MKKFIILLLLFIPSFVFAEDFDIYVSNTEEAINIIDEIILEKEIGDYYLSFDDNTIDFDTINNHFKEKYYSDPYLNTYRYSEYGKIHPYKFEPLISENMIFISNRKRKITNEEEEKLEEFTESFLKHFENKTDYEKIYMVYKYISENAVYQNEGVFNNLVDGYLSPYDVLIEHKTVCIGSATTFSYLMDKLGIESYIVDHVEKMDEDSGVYYTSHTFNIVKLDGIWYIVDIKYNNDFSGLLISNKNYQNESYNYDISISNEDYNRPDFDYDFNEIEEVVEAEIIKKGNESIYYIVLVLILIIIFLIIFIFIKKYKHQYK